MIIILVVIAVSIMAIFVLAASTSWFARALRATLYQLYRFSGCLALTFWLGACVRLFTLDGSAPQSLLLFVAPATVFSALAFGKGTVVILMSSNERWWMTILKLNFGLGSLICFPLGLLALTYYYLYAVNGIPNSQRRETTDHRWENWQFSGSPSPVKEVSVLRRPRDQA